MAVASRLHGATGSEGGQPPASPAPSAPASEPVAVPEAPAEPATPAQEPAPAAPEAPVEPATPAPTPQEPPAPDPNSPLEPTLVPEPPAPPEPAVPPPEPAVPVPAEEPPAEPAKDDIAERMEALSARELSVVKAERAQKQQNQETENRLRAYDEVLRLGREDPLKAMETLGISYQEVTNRILNDGQPGESDTVAQMQRKIEELEQGQKTAETNRVTSEQTQNYNNYVGDLKKLVDTSKNFPLISYYSAYDAVVQAVNQHYEATDQILGNDVALAQVETKLQKDVDGLLNLEHIRTAQEAAPVQQPPVPEPNAGQAPQSGADVDSGAPSEPPPPAAPAPPATVTSTLRNAQQGSAGPPAPAPILDDEESLNAAAKLITFDAETEG